MRLTYPGDPVSKGRPRVTPHGTYTPEKTKTAEETLGWALKLAWKKQPSTSDFMVGMEFHTKGKRRRDLDNLMKLVLDAGNSIVWADDSQVVELHGYLYRESPNPRTEIIVKEQNG